MAESKFARLKAIHLRPLRIKGQAISLWMACRVECGIAEPLVSAKPQPVGDRLVKALRMDRLLTHLNYF